MYYSVWGGVSRVGCTVVCIRMGWCWSDGVYCSVYSDRVVLVGCSVCSDGMVLVVWGVL